MRVAGVVIVALAACYAPGYEDCEVLCAAGTCPSGFSCELGVCRIEGATGPCGDPNGDNDHDGLINSMDNCPDKANPDQANEDSDMRGDVCDPCPIKPEPAADLDSDADGVGDGCDPFPSNPSRISLFEPFNAAPTSNPQLLPAASNWVFQAGKASLSNPGANVVGAMTWPMLPAMGEVIVAGFSVNQPATTPPSGAGVATWFDAPTAQAIVCWLGKESTGEGLELWRRGSTGMFSPYTFMAGATTRMTMTRTGDAYECTDLQNRRVANTIPAPSVGAPRTGLFVISAGVTFDYVMIVTRTN